jgi:Protein of unknown function, DUF481
VTRLLFAATMLVVAANAFAASKTDVVMLKNGDRFTCEVKELSRGQLKLSTDDVGTIYVEWDKVASVQTAGHYQVTTTSGALFVGTLAPASIGMLTVAGTEGTIDLGLLNIVSFSRINAGFWGRIDGALDVGGSYTQSSGVGQVSAAIDMTYRRPRYEVFTSFDGNITTQQEADRTTRVNWRAGYTQFRGNQWTLNPFVYVERNPDLGLTVRSTGALALGRFLYRSTRASLQLFGGASAGIEQPIEGDAVSNVDALLGITTSYYRYDAPRRNIDFTMLLFPSLNDFGRVRANAQVKLRQEVFRDFIAAISAYNSYDSRPAVENANLNDFGVTFSIGWTF